MARGRRPAGSGTREAIAAAARAQFADLGYPGTTLRSVAAQAGVDTRLVSHYFGTKQELFVQVVELPFDPDEVFETLLRPGREGVGQRAADFVVTILQTPNARQVMTGLVRAAASEEEAAALVREVLTQRLLLPLARRVGGDEPELRAALMGSQVVGLLFARHIVGIPALVELDAARMAAVLSPTLERYLLGDLPAPGDQGHHAAPR